MTYDVAIIGGGPSGLMAAISAAEHGAKTILIEKGNQLGKKLAISGGGRCNVTNRLPEKEVIKNIPGNGKFLYSPFSVFNNYDIIDFFEGLGVALKEEDHGRMFPVSNSAQTVVNTLIDRLKDLHVDLRMKTRVKELSLGDRHTIHLEEGTDISARALVLAVGGKSVPRTGSTGDGYPWAIKAGHTVTKLYPTEVPLTSSESFIKDKTLQGLSLRGVGLSVLNETGKKIVTHEMDMIFTHFGVSGPAVLRCSQFVVKTLLKGDKSVSLHLDAFPYLNEEELVQELGKAMKDYPRKSIKNIVREMVPERYAQFLLEKLAVDLDLQGANVSNKILRDLAKILKGFIFSVDGSLSIERAFVTGGGVSIKEVVPTTMESKVKKGLFFCGEILDIHGYTGGYNITSAIVTGRIAGMNAAFRE